MPQILTEKGHAGLVGCFSEGLCEVVDVEAGQMKQLHFVAHSYSFQGCFTQLLFRHQFVCTARMTTAGGAQGGLVGREVQGSTWAPRFGMYQLETRNFPPLKTTSGSLIFSPSDRGCTSCKAQSKTISLVCMGALF